LLTFTEIVSFFKNKLTLLVMLQWFDVPFSISLGLGHVRHIVYSAAHCW